MTFAGYYQKYDYSDGASTLGGVPFGEPQDIARNILVFIVTNAPEGEAIQKWIEEKMTSPSSGITLTVCAEPDCPDDIREQIKVAIGNPRSNVNEVHWGQLHER